jgi:hypothetical protein
MLLFGDTLEEKYEGYAAHSKKKLQVLSIVP